MCDCVCESLVTSYNLRSVRTQSCGCICKEKNSERTKINLAGQKIGKLTVMTDVGRNRFGRVLWQCQCECGNGHVVSSIHLLSGAIKSCGCLLRKNLVDLRFGRLKVVACENKRSAEGRQVWKCICDCGNNVKVSTNHLTKGGTVSCGCFHKENSALLGMQRVGPKSSNWKGGISREPYCQDWTKEYKEFIKERDGHKCLNPYCNRKFTKLHVHHIKYIKKNCDRFNLITLCGSCNSKANTDREWHESWYKAIIYRRYVGD